MNEDLNSWDKFCNYLWFEEKLNIWLDISKINFTSKEIKNLEDKFKDVFSSIKELENGQKIIVGIRPEYLIPLSQGIEFIGMGISGGETGARTGPALMLGYEKEIPEDLISLISKVAAKADGLECVGLYEGFGTGHFIKMLHN